MRPDAYVRKGDAGSKIVAVLTKGGAAVNLAGATVGFIMSRGGAVKVNAPATVEDAAAGKVSYTWAAADLDTPGLYDAEWQVTVGTTIETYPDDRYLRILVVEDLD